jgi:hypothetical protein
MDLSQHNAGVVNALEELKGTAAAPVLEEIGTETLLNDLRSIIIDEIGDNLANLIVREYSGKEFTEDNVLDLLRSTIQEPHTTPKSPEQTPALEPEPCLTTSPEPKATPDKPKKTDKPKRKNKVSGYNLFKKDPEIKEKINVEYIPRKEQDKSLKFSTVAAEMWKKVDQTPYTKQAEEINKANEEAKLSQSAGPASPAPHPVAVPVPVAVAVAADTPVNATASASTPVSASAIISTP